MHTKRGPLSRKQWAQQPLTDGNPLIDARLEAHLRQWLGAWPPARPMQVIGSTVRQLPGWDGATYPVVGVSDGTAMVLSVPPPVARQLRQTDPGDRDPVVVLARALGRPADVAAQATWSRLVFRWTTRPAVSRDLGVCATTDHLDVPPWLRPFNGDVLVALDTDGTVAAGVGRKQHTPYGHEIAVVTEPDYRGRGLARALVGQMARRILAERAVPLYIHAPDNHASARVADGAGFPDRGWQLWEL